MVDFSRFRYSGFLDDYASYSSCKKKKAMKEYECFVTGKRIRKGEEYKELCCWNPVRGKHFRFKLSVGVSREIILNLRRDPEHSEVYKYKPKRILGFFSY